MDRERGEAAVDGRARRMERWLAGLDRGEVIEGRIVQVLGEETARVGLGPGALVARAVGGRPEIGPCRLEVVVPGPRPVLRILADRGGTGVEILVDASHEKQRDRGLKVDRRI